MWANWEEKRREKIDEIISKFCRCKLLIIAVFCNFVLYIMRETFNPRKIFFKILLSWEEIFKYLLKGKNFLSLRKFPLKRERSSRAGGNFDERYFMKLLGKKAKKILKTQLFSGFFVSTGEQTRYKLWWYTEEARFVRFMFKILINTEIVRLCCSNTLLMKLPK